MALRLTSESLGDEPLNCEIHAPGVDVLLGPKGVSRTESNAVIELGAGHAARRESDTVTGKVGAVGRVEQKDVGARPVGAGGPDDDRGVGARTANIHTLGQPFANGAAGAKVSANKI